MEIISEGMRMNDFFWHSLDVTHASYLFFWHSLDVTHASYLCFMRTPALPCMPTHNSIVKVSQLCQQHLVPIPWPALLLY